MPSGGLVMVVLSFPFGYCIDTEQSVASEAGLRPMELVGLAVRLRLHFPCCLVPIYEHDQSEHFRS
jgi:hypothetical protein